MASVILFLIKITIIIIIIIIIISHIKVRERVVKKRSEIVSSHNSDE